MERTQLLDPLGFARLRVLDCLGGNDRHAVSYFAPDTDRELFLEFRRHIERLNEQWAAETDSLTRNLLAAGRLVIGDIGAVFDILDHAPSHEIKLDHGAGACTVVPFTTIVVVFPMPNELSDSRKWQSGSLTLEAVRNWLRQHRDRLRWSEADGVYRLT
jgi:hypothetical protein